MSSSRNSYDEFKDTLRDRMDREQAYKEFRASDTRQTFEVISDGVSQSRSIARSLDHLASAFSATGNDHVANTLYTVAEDLVRILDEIRSAHNREMNHHFQESQSMLGLTIAAAVAVSTREHDSRVRIAELESSGVSES